MPCKDSPINGIRGTGIARTPRLAKEAAFNDVDKNGDFYCLSGSSGCAGGKKCQFQGSDYKVTSMTVDLTTGKYTAEAIGFGTCECGVTSHM